jgi:hypothetical protein
VGNGLDELLLADAVVPGVLQVEGKLLGVAAGGQRGERDQAAVTRRQLRALPRLTEQDVIGEVHEPGGEAAEHLPGADGSLSLVVSLTGVLPWWVALG